MLRFQSPSSSVSQKGSVNESPPRSSKGALLGELPVSRAFSYMSLEFLYKSSPDNKKFLPSLECPKKGKTPHVPQNGAPMEKSISGDLLSISFGVPSKGALPPGSPRTAPTERMELTRKTNKYAT